MEGVLEKLAVRPLALADLFDLDHNDRLPRRVAQRVIDPTTAQGVLGGDDLRVVDGPAESMEQALDDALRDGRLVDVATGLDAGTDVQQVFLHLPLP